MSETLAYGCHSIDDADVAAVVEALRSDRITQGERVERFEAALAQYCGARHAIAVSSGSAALHLACLALGLERAAGGPPRVATTPLSFLATANAIGHCGGRAVFADVDADTWNLCPLDLARVAETGSAPLRGVVAVDFAGHPCDIEAISAVAKESGAFVVRDACHALGASWLDRAGQSHRVGDGAFSDATCLSFHPVKHITTGEGGALLTQSDRVAERCRELRENGMVRNTDPESPWVYEMHAPGFNYRISDIQCALGLSQLGRLERGLARRREIAHMYDEAFASVSEVAIPRSGAGVEHAWHLYVLRVPDRQRVFNELRARGIGVQVHYVPIHLQPYYRKRSPELELPEAERYYARALSIPMHPGLRDTDVARVVEEVKRAVAGAPR